MPPNDNADDPRMPIYPMEVYRVKKGMRLFVRVLATKYQGCFTHWYRGRSHYCDPDGCPPLLHKTERVWKGYFAGEAWVDDMQHWLGLVIELTEHSELDVRLYFCRGQVIEFSRGLSAPGRNLPTTAKRCELLDAKALPSSFDIMPAVQRCYHCPHIRLDQANPMPPRPTRPASIGDAPAQLEQQRSVEAATPEDMARLKSGIADFLRPKKHGS